MAAARRSRGGATTTNRAKKRPARKGGGPSPRRGRRRSGSSLWLNLLGLAIFGATLGAVALGGLFWYYSRDLPDVHALRSYDPPQTTRILSRDGGLIGELFTERRTVVPMSDIPRVLVLSVLAAEDADFYQHSGMDMPGILRILIKTAIHGRATQGASTITQQVVKNLILSPERTIERKVKELILARRLEQELDKDEILFLYLNHINFGHGRYGVQEASQYYFGKDVSELNLAEASLIAGIPQAPARLSPRTHPEAARRRQTFVLDQLEKKREQYWSDLPPGEIQKAREQPPELVERKGPSRAAAEAFALARAELEEAVGAKAAAQGGYTVHTSIDLELQRAARDAVERGLEAHDERHGHQAPLRHPRVTEAQLSRRLEKKKKRRPLKAGRFYDAYLLSGNDEENTLSLLVGGWPAEADLRDLERYNPEHVKASEFGRRGVKTRARVVSVPEDGPVQVEPALGPEGGAIVIDVRTRRIRALIGGYEAQVGAFNRATQALRQPGSTFKPVVYAEGLRSRKFTPASLVIDAPEVFDEWRPSNYETWSYSGPVRLRVGLAKSINLVAVRVIDTVGPEQAAAFAHDLGIRSELAPSLALALGASEVRLSELTNAYATFAAGGRYQPLRLVTRIEDHDGRPVPLPEAEPARDVMTPAEAFLITSMLTSVVREGTGARAQRLGRPAAGKTGTSNQARDAWFVGFTPETAAGVWVGYDDHRPLGRKESGGRSALPIWVNIMEAATQGQPETDFAVPAGIETASIDPESGLLAHEGLEDPLVEYFLEGTAPTEVARPPDVADPTTFLMEQYGDL